MAVLSHSMVDQFVAAARAGVPRETVCQAAGVGASTLREWLHAADTGCWFDGSSVSQEMRDLCSALSRGYAQAQAEHEAAMVERITQAAHQVNDKTGINEWRAGAWYLEHAPHTKGRWGQQVQIEQQISVTTTQRTVRALSDTELEQLASATLPEPTTPDPEPSQSPDHEPPDQRRP